MSSSVLRSNPGTDISPGKHGSSLLSKAGKLPELPKTASDALWNYARDVDAAYVRTTDQTRGEQSEVERFLFYRGLGQAKMPLGLAYSGGGTLTLPADAILAQTSVCTPCREG